jgi:hypothetical protein
MLYALSPLCLIAIRMCVAMTTTNAGSIGSPSWNGRYISCPENVTLQGWLLVNCFKNTLGHCPAMTLVGYLRNCVRFLSSKYKPWCKRRNVFALRWIPPNPYSCYRFCVDHNLATRRNGVSTKKFTGFKLCNINAIQNFLFCHVFRISLFYVMLKNPSKYEIYVRFQALTASSMMIEPYGI